MSNLIQGEFNIINWIGRQTYGRDVYNNVTRYPLPWSCILKPSCVKPVIIYYLKEILKWKSDRHRNLKFVERTFHVYQNKQQKLGDSDKNLKLTLQTR